MFSEGMKIVDRIKARFVKEYISNLYSDDECPWQYYTIADLICYLEYISGDEEE